MTLNSAELNRLQKHHHDMGGDLLLVIEERLAQLSTTNKEQS